MSEKQTGLSQEFIGKIAQFSAGYIPPETLDKFIELVEKEISQHYFTWSSESNLLRIITGMFDKTSFINECILYPHFIEILALISINSNYLTDILVRNPEYFYWIVNPSNLNQELNAIAFREEVQHSLAQYHSLTSKVNALRRIKRKETLRTGVKDLLKLSTVKEVTQDLSIIARVITAELFELCYSDVINKYGLVNISNRYCIASLGKLGGNELNYSSDIDLIIFFDKNSVYGKKEYFELLSDAIYLFIEHSGSITSSGYIYRVDFRLRPDGKNSPLCRTINDYLLYYESRGEDWERQMLLKAGFCGGDKELFDKFIAYLQPFIFPLTFSVSPTEQIYKLKSNIEKNLRSDDNIKLSPGGIRDIEFSVQALQLLNGGNIKGIRTGNTLDAVDLLCRNNLLGKEETQTFTETYILYRKVEHYLQLMNDKQTHEVPESGELVEKLSFFLGYKSMLEFKKDLTSKRSKVKRIFTSIMGMDEEQEISYTHKIKFENPQRSDNDLTYLREGKGILGMRQFDKSSIGSFLLIENNLLKYLETSGRPDKILRNFVRIIKNVPFPSLWYREFNDRKLFNNFLRLCEFSQKSIDLFAEDAELREYFISRTLFEKPDIKTCASYPVKKLLFLLSTHFILNKVNAVQFGKILQANIINKITFLAGEIIPPDIKYFIAGLGSFGTAEMNFSSDVDLIFIVKNINTSPDTQKYFQKLLAGIRTLLKPIEADCRLRPEGQSSQLVWDINSYKHYLMSRARIWELQSLCKLKFVTGEKKLFNEFTNVIASRCLRENKENIKKEILDMRKKLSPAAVMDGMNIINLKKCRGGLLDIEFAIQFRTLCSPELFRKILNCTTQGKISLLFKEDLNIQQSYIFLKEIILWNQCVFNSSTYQYKEDEKENIKFKDELRANLRVNQNLYNKIMGS